MITDPFKLYLVVIYRPPGQLGSFVDELDILLFALPMDNCPLLGGMNIHMDNSHSADVPTSCPYFCTTEKLINTLLLY